MTTLLLFRSLFSTNLRNQTFSHTPALLKEVINVFNSSNRTIALDLTFGYGGHSKAMLEFNKDLKLIAVDRDSIAFDCAVSLSNSYSHLKPVKAKFSDLNQICEENHIMKNSVDFILMDLGCSSMQMDDASRGFSLSKNAKLDMRMDQNSSDITALDVVNHLGAPQLANIFKRYGEERESRAIANLIVEYRTTVGPIITTHQLSDLVFQLIKRSKVNAIGKKAHQATLIFQALRIFVNDELNELCSALTLAEKYLKPITGRCVVISFHSLEDRLVKWAFNDKNFQGVDKAVANLVDFNIKENKSSHIWFQEGDIITPSNEEIKSNPRIRSAKMRVGKVIQE